MEMRRPGLAREAAPSIETRPVRAADVEAIRPAPDRHADAAAAARARDVRRTMLQRGLS